MLAISISRYQNFLRYFYHVLFQRISNHLIYQMAIFSMQITPSSVPRSEQCPYSRAASRICCSGLHSMKTACLFLTLTFHIPYIYPQKGSNFLVWILLSSTELATYSPGSKVIPEVPLLFPAADLPVHLEAHARAWRPVRDSSLRHNHDFLTEAAWYGENTAEYGVRKALIQTPLSHSKANKCDYHYLKCCGED